MRRSVYTKLIFALFACSCFFISENLTAQTESVQPKFKQVFVYIPKTKSAVRIPQKNNSGIIDSLKKVILESDSVYQRLLFQSAKKDSVIDQSNQRILKQQPALHFLQTEVSKYQAMNAQTKKNNFILFIFNSIVCVLLFFMLIRYLLNLRRKKSHAAQKRIIVSPEKTSPSSVPAEQNKIGHNLEQLEKLGKLRDAGILTEEEFIFQKKKVLGN
jgi:hypothetical protein